MLSTNKCQNVQLSDRIIPVTQLTIGAILNMIAKNPALTESLIGETVDIAAIVANAPDYADSIIVEVCVASDLSADITLMDKTKIVFATVEMSVKAFGEASESVGKFVAAITSGLNVYPKETPELSVKP